MPEDIMFQEATQAIRQGQRGRARDLLTRLLRTDQSNPEYWLWMSSVVETPKEQVYCLQSVLRLDPNNRAAKKGLVLLGARPPETDVTPMPPIHRKWEVPVLEVPRYSRWKVIWANPVLRGMIIASAVILLVIVAGFGVYQIAKPKARPVAVIPTKTYGPSPTFTLTPTAINHTPTPPTPTPTLEGPLPLWARLEATYTPTPFLAGTPHPANEAYSIALRSYQRGDLEKALENLRQAQQMNPEAADISFLMGEIYRMQGQYEQALEAFQQAMEINADYAPAYLGAAQAQWALDPQAEAALENLQQAIEKNPQYGEAFLERAAYYLTLDELDSAMQDLEAAMELLPTSPLVHLYLAQVHQAKEEQEAALEEAQRALELDLTLLPAYRLLGEAAVQNGEYDKAIEALNTYTTYVEDDPGAWAALGQAYLPTENYSQTLKILDKALQLDKNLPEAHFYRGLVLIELEQGQEAVNEIYLALQYDPKSFFYNLSFARALLVAGRLSDALGQIGRAYDLAEDEEELAQAHYWRALILEAIGNYRGASKEWKALLSLKLDDGSVPPDWLETAQQRLTTTPTALPSATETPTPSKTPTITATARPSSTPTATRLTTQLPTSTP